MEVTASNTCISTRQNSLDTQEFQAFYRENLHLIYRYVYSKVGNREEAEDLTSHIFLKAVRSLNYERGPYSTRSWLFRVAHTTITDYWRAHGHIATSSLEALLEAGWEGPAEGDLFGIGARAIERLQRLLQALPERYQEVLTCRFLLGLSIRETAVRMNLAEGNVKAVQLRALKRAAALEALGASTVETNGIILNGSDGGIGKPFSRN
jgi:RNA polymerase sigma-70 factor, ECF subfamily